MANLMVILHIIAGSIALFSGFSAIYYKKGSKQHRRWGKIFVYSMAMMGGLGAYLAYFKPEFISTINGLFTVYLVTTAWVTVKGEKKEVGNFEKGAFIIVLTIFSLDMYAGTLAMNSESGLYHNFPAGIYFFFGSVAGIATIFDGKLLFNGGISGAARMTRHIWRMCFALLIASASFFLGQMQVFPQVLQRMDILALPVLFVLFTLVYWLYKSIFTTTYKRSR